MYSNCLIDWAQTALSWHWSITLKMYREMTCGNWVFVVHLNNKTLNYWRKNIEIELKKYKLSNITTNRKNVLLLPFGNPFEWFISIKIHFIMFSAVSIQCILYDNHSTIQLCDSWIFFFFSSHYDYIKC